MCDMSQYVPHKHVLSETTFYETLACDVCHRRGGSSHAKCISCPTCNMDICEACFKQLRFAPKKHNHTLYLTRRDYICNLCRKKYLKIYDSLYCERCNFDICTNCAITR